MDPDKIPGMGRRASVFPVDLAVSPEEISLKKKWDAEASGSETDVQVAGTSACARLARPGYDRCSRQRNEQQAAAPHGGKEAAKKRPSLLTEALVVSSRCAQRATMASCATTRAG